MGFPGRYIDFWLVALVAIVFGHTIAFGFVDWDDLDYILLEPLVRNPLANGWKHLLLTPSMGYPVPGTVLTRSAIFAIGQGQPWAFHLLNVAVHVVNVIVARRLLCTIGVHAHAAALAAAIWAVHPIVAEPVSWITGGKDLLATAFALGALLCFCRSTSTRQNAGATIAFCLLTLLAMSCSPRAVYIPFVAIGFVLVARRRPDRAMKAALTATTMMVPLVAIMTYRFQQDLNAVRAYGLGTRLLFMIQHLALQLQNYVYPVALSPRYHENLPQPLFSATSVCSLVALVCLSYLAIWIWRRHGVPGRSLLVFAILSFIPASGVLSLKRGPADSYFYVTSLALAAAFGLALTALMRRLHDDRHRRFAHLFTLSVVITLALVAFVQSSIWARPSTLWDHERDIYPNVPDSWWNLADGHLAENRIAMGMAVYEDALKRFPSLRPKAVYLNLGLGYAKLARWEESARAYGKALHESPDDPAIAQKFLRAYQHAPLDDLSDLKAQAEATINRH